MHRPDLFIDMLRSRLVTGRLGATVLDGLVGTNDIPKQIGSSTAQWVGEDGSLTESDADFDDVSLTPKTVGAMTSFSRRTLINSQPSIENLVRRDLAAVVARAIDFAALMGNGAGNMPTGIASTTGVHALTFASGPTWDQVTAFAAAIESDDADAGTMGWAMTPKAARKFRTTLKVDEDAGAGFIMDTRGSLDGFNVATTTALPDNDGNSPVSYISKVIFGAWNQLLVGYWSGLDLLVNPYAETAYAKGRVMVRAMRDCDIAVRHAESFAYASDLTVGE
jgi:HK97 family phage major capsid protein